VLAGGNLAPENLGGVSLAVGGLNSHGSDHLSLKEV
jgi:hypothetical protein